MNIYDMGYMSVMAKTLLLSVRCPWYTSFLFCIHNGCSLGFGDGKVISFQSICVDLVCQAWDLRT